MSELYHWGIKGQKWGDRRFQNYDGSLTTAGRLRYGVGSAVRGGVFDSSNSLSKRAKRLGKFGTALAKAKTEQYGNSARQGIFKAKKSIKSLPKKIGTQKSVANELKNRATQLEYYTKKNKAVKDMMQRFADVAYLSDRRFETRAAAGRTWVSNALRPATSRNNLYDSPRKLLRQYVPVTRDLQGSFKAKVKGTHYSASKIKDMFGVWPNTDDDYRKTWW